MVPATQQPLSILLVDDEMLIRLNTADILQDLGHKVLDAGSGSEALELLKSAEIDVLLTDVHMAGMSGLELAAAVKSILPAVAVIFATGDNDVTGYTPGPEEQFAILGKPYTQQDIVDALARVATKSKPLLKAIELGIALIARFPLAVDDPYALALSSCPAGIRNVNLVSEASDLTSSRPPCAWAIWDAM